MSGSAIRAAIGASRGRIVRQLLVERDAGSRRPGCRLWSRLRRHRRAGRVHAAPGRAVGDPDRLDQPVLFFAVLAAAVATLGFGLYPAMQSVRSDLVASAGLGGRTTAGRRQTRMRSGLVVAQVALSIVLLLGAGVLMRTFVGSSWDSIKNLLVAGVAFPPRQNPSADESHRFHRQALARIGTIPGGKPCPITPRRSAAGKSAADPGTVVACGGFGLHRLLQAKA